MLSPIRRLWYHKQASCSAHLSTRWQRRCETSITQPPPSAPICGKHAPSARGSPTSRIHSMTPVSCCLRTISTRARPLYPSTSGDASASRRRFIVCSSISSGQNTRNRLLARGDAPDTACSSAGIPHQRRRCQGCQALRAFGTHSGTGKTTVATNLATLFATQKTEVLLVDADPQQSALEWQRDRLAHLPEVSVIGLPAPNLQHGVFCREFCPSNVEILPTY